MNPDVVITDWDTEEMPKIVLEGFQPTEATVFKPVAVSNVSA